jgi:hypothetical protein
MRGTAANILGGIASREQRPISISPHRDEAAVEAAALKVVTGGVLGSMHVVIRIF